MIDWNQILQSFLSTATIIGAFAWVSQQTIKHLLSRDIERLKNDLKSKNDLELEKLKSDLNARNTIELEKVKKRFEDDLINRRHQAELEKERFRQTLETETSAKGRILSEISSWANPILGATRDLESRLSNILYDHGYLALDLDAEKQVNPNWSVSYGYFMSSTLYIFGQYFCWINMFMSELSFELFTSQQQKELLFEAIFNVIKSFSDFPPIYSGEGRDIQVFYLQQRAIGEMLTVKEDGKHKCMGYHEFTLSQKKEEFHLVLKPLEEMVEAIKPGERRWERLKASHVALSELRSYCEGLLKIQHS